MKKYQFELLLFLATVVVVVVVVVEDTRKLETIALLFLAIVPPSNT